MRLHSWRKKSASGTNTRNSGITHIGKGGVAEGTFAVGSEVAKDIAQYKHPVFTHQIPEFLVASRCLMSSSEQWKADDSEVNAASRVMSGLGVVPECLLTDKVGTNNSRAFGHRNVPVVVNYISDGRPTRGFADRFHPGR
jgi:hypothetical protein